MKVQHYDPDLCEPFEKVKRRIEALSTTAPQAAKLLQADLSGIQTAVATTYKEYDERCFGKNIAFWKLPVLERQDILRHVVAVFHATLEIIDFQILHEDVVGSVAASYAYIYDMEGYNETHERFLNRGTEYVRIHLS